MTTINILVKVTDLDMSSDGCKRVTVNFGEDGREELTFTETEETLNKRLSVELNKTFLNKPITVNELEYLTVLTDDKVGMDFRILKVNINI